MAQTLLTPQIITRKALESLENNMVMPKLVHRSFEPMFRGKIGSTLTVRKPNKFTVQDGPTISVEDINEPSVTMTINKWKVVPFQFNDADMALTIEEFTERYIEPACIPLANAVDRDLLALASQFSNVVGTPGVTPTTFASSVQLTGQRMDENGVPPGEQRNLVVNPAANWAMAGAQSNAFVTRVSEKALINGYLNQIGNQYVFMDQNVGVTTAPVYGGTPLTNGVNQTGASLITDGWTATTTVLPAGTVFTIADVYAVNPVSFQSTGVLKNFVVTTTTVTDGSGNSTIAISPAIITSGPFQNVTGPAADGKAIVVKTGATTTTAVNNIAFTKSAMGLCMVPLMLPGGMDMAYRVTHNNISIRFVRGFDITNSQFISRLDILYGVAQYYDELGVRLLG